MSAPSGTVTTTCEPTSVFPDADVTATPPADRSTWATGQSWRTSSPAAIASTTERIPVLGHVAEVVAAVLLLRPEPLQRLVLGRTGRVRLDTRAEPLPGSSEGVTCEARRRQVGLDALGGRGGRAQPRAQPFERLGVAFELDGQARLDVRMRQPEPGRAVEGGQGRHRVGGPASDADRLGEVPQRVADRVVHPRAAEVHPGPGQVRRVQPPTDPAPGLEHHAVHSGVRHRIGHREPGDTGTDHQHALDGPDDPSRDLGVSVVEQGCHRAVR